MADKDLNDIIQQLITALKGISSDKAKTFTAQDKTRAEETSEKSAAQIAEIFAKQEHHSKEIEKNTLLTQQHAENTIDAEQIINELKEERIRQITEEYRENQLVLLQLRKKLEEAEKDKNISEETLGILREKISLYEAETREQAKILEGHKKEKETKEKILSIGKEILSTTLKYGQELEKHIIEISRLNGGYDKYKESLREANNLMYAASVGTGLRIEELNKGFQALSANFIGLSTQSAQSMKDMSLAVSQLGKLGIDANTASKSFDSLVVAMGKTPQQAIKIQDSFTQMAAKNRLALGSVTQAFAENSNRFIGFGEQMTKVLDGLAEQSLKTGIAIGKLVGIAQGFDTFEDASRKVGNLNALLGGDYFNSIELLTATDEERIKLLKEGVAASGIQFESMNRFQQMAIANAAGISDLNEASKLFGQTSLQNTRQQAEGAAVQKTLAEQAQSMTLATDKLKSSLNGLILILEPIVTTFMEVVSVFSNVIQGANKILSETFLGPTGSAIVISSLMFLISKFSILGRVIGKVGNIILGRLVTAFSSLTASAAPAGASTATAITTIGSAATASAVGLLALGGAIALIGIGIGVAALGFSKLVASFKDLTNAGTALLSIAVIMVGFIATVALLAFVAVKATIPLTILGGNLMFIGAAVAFIGAGIGLAAAGIGYMISSISNLVDSIGKINKADFDALFKLFSDDNIKKVEKFAEAISKLSEPFNTLNNNINSIATNMSIIFPNISLDIASAPNSLSAFLSELSNIDIEPINNLANAIYNLTTNLEALASIPSKMGINVTGKTDLTETINKTVANAAEATTAVAKAATTAATQPLIPAQQTTAFVPLVVQIDKQTILKVLDVEEMMDGKITTAINTIGVVRRNSGIQSAPPQETIGD